MGSESEWLVDSSWVVSKRGFWRRSSISRDETDGIFASRLDKMPQSIILADARWFPDVDWILGLVKLFCTVRTCLLMRMHLCRQLHKSED